MTIQSLDHYTINVAALEASVAFYEGVVGLHNGDRPAFPFPGAWLYCGDIPIVHLVADNADSASEGTGTIDHVAFRCADLDAYTQDLRDRSIAFIERDVPGFPLHQVFLKDPDGVTIELNFWDETETSTSTDYEMPRVAEKV